MDRLLSRHNSTARLGSALEVGFKFGTRVQVESFMYFGISWQLQSLNAAV